ncbi:MAG: toxin-antitoxin system TumE family protein [Thermoproteota archaeon]
MTIQNAPLFEYVNSQLEKIDYAYHYQKPHGTLIFRYDTAHHYPELDSFPITNMYPDKNPLNPLRIWM